jgi:hypothetical protein
VPDWRLCRIMCKETCLIKTIKEWLTVWLFVAMMGVALILVAVLMPFFALHKVAVEIQEWWYTK